MRNLFIIFVTSICIGNSYAQITEKQLRVIFSQIVDETVVEAKLKGEYEKVARDFLNSTLLNKDVMNELLKIVKERNITDSKKAFELGFESMAIVREASMKFLSNRDLYDLMKLNIELLSKMNNYECAQYVRKRNTEKEGVGRGVYEIAGNLGIQEFKKYFGLYEKAFKNMMQKKNESQAISDSELQAARSDYRRFFMDLLEENADFNNFIKSGKSFNDLGEAEVCRFGKSLMGLVVKGDAASASVRTQAYLSGKLN